MNAITAIWIWHKTFDSMLLVFFICLYFELHIFETLNRAIALASEFKTTELDLLPGDSLCCSQLKIWTMHSPVRFSGVRKMLQTHYRSVIYGFYINVFLVARIIDGFHSYVYNFEWSLISDTICCKSENINIQLHDSFIAHEIW